MTTSLSGKRVAFLVTDGFEQVELTGPRDALQQAGATVDILSEKAGQVKGWNHDKPADDFAANALFFPPSTSGCSAIIWREMFFRSASIRAAEMPGRKRASVL